MKLHKLKFYAWLLQVLTIKHDVFVMEKVCEPLSRRPICSLSAQTVLRAALVAPTG